MSPQRTEMLEGARDALLALETFASQVEDGQRSGDLGQLLGHAAIVASNLAVVEALDGVIYVANANAV